jgi:flavin reductase (DIM6/NTAB) family NADH-FMN oxidoreductase RutF
MGPSYFDGHRNFGSVSWGVTHSTVPAARLHRLAQPKIIYPGTPVVLISSANPDGSTNLAPMSSFWALGWTALLGLGRNGQTSANLERTGECVINFPGPDLWPAVERLAPLTGRNPPAPKVQAYGGRYEPDKFGAAGLTPMASDLVQPPRVQECQLQLEARVVAMRVLADEPDCLAVEARVLRVHASEEIVKSNRRHIDPDRWRPLLYNFRCYYGLGPELGRSFREGREG